MTIETHQLIPGPSGELETLITKVEQPQHAVFAVLCHPHPQQEGTMRNKVVTTLMKAYDMLGIPTIRFNYRGVGQSAGEYDHAVGEIEDALAAVQYMQAHYPDFKCAMAGFSFGAYIAAATANKINPVHLITLAPVIAGYPFAQLTIQCPWLAMIGADDDVASVPDLEAFVKTRKITFEIMPEAGHFFHGQLIPLREQLIGFLKNSLINHDP